MADDHQSLSSSGLRRSTAVSVSSAAAASAALRPPAEQGQAGLKCPRCDSPNTKFCYYNNYSLSQPRHFCKSCRRYWTKGGALRNVPVGGGCRKNKKSKSSSAVLAAAGGASGQKFLSAPPDPLGGDLHHVGILPFTRLHPPAAPTVFDGNHYFSSSATGSQTPSSVSVSDPMFSLNYHPISAVGIQNEMSTVAGGSGVSSAIGGSKNNSLISSIESLSSINQDLHLKLQQQRLAAFFGGRAAETNQEDQEAAPCDMLQRSKDGGAYGVSSSPAAWFIDSTCTTQAMTSMINPITENNINDDNMMSNNTANNWNGISGWSDLHQFATLP